MKATESKPILRFAPSPTGYLHVGGARTALFNWLYARHTGGTFLLRIEDTDQQRSTREAEQQIIDALSWLGLNWDGAVYYQSRQQQRHQQVVRELLEEGKAYYCFCTKEELDQKRVRAEQQKINQRYDGTCRNLSAEQIQRNLDDQKSFTVRFKVPNGKVHYQDKILGTIQTENNTLDDFIIQRADGTPIYNLAVVCDDHDMGVNLVLRGQDHIANTNKQILLYEALNWPVPDFGHIPLILGVDKQRLSKRHGATSVGEFREQGILSQALVNYLCLLGWSPGNDQEVMPIDEIINLFSVEQINHAAAVFDIQKLTWMNARWMAALSSQQIERQAEQWLEQNGKTIPKSESERFKYFLTLLQVRSKTLLEFNAGLELYFSLPESYEIKGVEKYFRTDGVSGLLMELLEALKNQEDSFYLNIEEIESFLRDFAFRHNLSAGKLIHPLRLALTGSTASPGIFELIFVLGKGKVLGRIGQALQFINGL